MRLGLEWEKVVPLCLFQLNKEILSALGLSAPSGQSRSSESTVPSLGSSSYGKLANVEVHKQKVQCIFKSWSAVMVHTSSRILESLVHSVPRRSFIWRTIHSTTSQPVALHGLMKSYFCWIAFFHFLIWHPKSHVQYNIVCLRLLEHG